MLFYYLGEPQKGMDEIKKAMRIDPFCSDLMFEVEGTCHFWLGNYQEAINSYKKLKIDTRDSLFYSAASHKKLNNNDKSSNILKQALNTLNMTIEKFINSQPLKSEEHKKDLTKLITSIN